MMRRSGTTLIHEHPTGADVGVRSDCKRWRNTPQIFDSNAVDTVDVNEGGDSSETMEQQARHGRRSGCDDVVETGEDDGAVVLVVGKGPAPQEKIRNRMFRDGAGDESSSASSEAASSRQPQTHATHPETPPPPDSHHSVHSSSSSSRSPLIQTNVIVVEGEETSGYDPPPPPAPESPVATRSHNEKQQRSPRTPRRSGARRGSSSSQQSEISFSNPFSCYSPNLRSKTVSRREVMGHLTYVQAYDESTTEEQEQRQPAVEEEDASVATETSEEQLELAAHQIRTNLLQAEMTELAQEAERAAENGQDSFAAQPCVFQDDMEIVQQRKPENKAAGKIVQQRKQENKAGNTINDTPPKLVRRVRSEGGAALPLRRQRGSTTSLGSSTTRQVRNSKVSVVDLRDVNEVFPSFRQFHTHLRTHFFRSDVSQEQLLFEEPKDADDKQGLQEQELKQQRSSSMTMTTPVPDRSGMLICKQTESAAAALFPMCANESSATPLQPKGRKHHHTGDFLFDFKKWVQQKSQKDLQPRDPIAFNYSQEDASEGCIGDLLSGHIAAGPLPFRPKIHIPPGLEAVHVSSAVSRLQPKKQRENPFRESSYTAWDHRVETESSFSENNSHAQSPLRVDHKLHHVLSLPARLDGFKPKALFDETFYDSYDEDDIVDAVENISVIELLANGEPAPKIPHPSQRRSGEIRQSSSDSLVEEKVRQPQLLRRSSNSLIGEGEGTRKNPIPVLVQDYVTPVHLRTIRRSRDDFEEAGLLLPSNSLAEDSPLRLSMTKNDFHERIQMPVLETVLDVSDSLNASGSMREPSPIVLPAYAERAPSEGDRKKDFSEDDLPTPPASPVLSSLRKAYSHDIYSSEPMTLETAVKLNSPPHTPRPQRLQPCLSFPPQTHSPLRTSLPEVEKQADDSLENSLNHSAPQTPEGAQQTDIRPPPSPNVLDTCPHKFEFSPKPAASQSLPQSPVSKLYFGVEKFMSKAVDEHLEETPAQGSEKADKLLDISFLVADTPPEMNVNNCDFLSLPPAASYHEGDTDPHLDSAGSKDLSPRRKLRKSTSTGALFDGVDACRHNPGRTIRAAMNRISSLSPKSDRIHHQRALYVRTKENDAFINNFLYCSRPNENTTEERIREAFCVDRCADANMACGEVGREYCCTSILEDAFSMGRFFGKHNSNRPLLRLNGGDGMRASRFDCDFDRWTCDVRRESNPSTSVSFQAPSLKKSKNSRLKLGDNAIAEELGDDTETDPPDDDGGDFFDEKKFDGVGLYDIDEPIGASPSSANRVFHARHLSLMEGSETSTSTFRDNSDDNGQQQQQQPHHSLSERQFQLMYGLSRGSFEAKTNADHSFLQP